MLPYPVSETRLAAAVTLLFCKRQQAHHHGQGAVPRFASTLPFVRPEATDLPGFCLTGARPEANSTQIPAESQSFTPVRDRTLVLRHPRLAREPTGQAPLCRQLWSSQPGTGALWGLGAR